MAKKTKSLVFLGNECLSSSPHYDRAPVLQALLDEGYEIEALIVKNKGTRSRTSQHPAILRLAGEYGLNIVKVATPEDLAAAVKPLTSRLAVLASFGLILKDEILQRFPLGIINIHPSLLPAYRGPTPIEQAIVNGDKKTGVSLMRVSSEA